jgi:hypothetical protein
MSESVTQQEQTKSKQQSSPLEANSCSGIEGNSPSFMELENSLPCSQQPTNGPYPEPDESKIFEVFTVVKISIVKMDVFWVVAPCSLGVV